MSVVTGKLSENNPFRVRENFSNNRGQATSSPNSQDTESMSTTQDEDFKNIDRSSSFQTSTSSPTWDSESTVKEFIQHDEVQDTHFYSAPSFNHNGLINKNHANHFRKSMSTFDSMTSISSNVSDSNAQLPATETPTKKLGMTNSPSIQALGAILTSKSKSNLHISTLKSTIEEDEGSDDILNDDGAGATQLNGSSQVYNSQHNNQSVATFYSAVSSQSITETTTIKNDMTSQLDNPSYILDNSEDLISLSSTIKDGSVSLEQSPYKQESIGKANRVSILQAGSTPVIEADQMTPHLFSPAMVFTQPVQGLQILLPSNLPAASTSTYAHLDSSRSDQSQASASPKKIGYEEVEEDSFLVDPNPQVEPASTPDFSIRVIDDNAITKDTKVPNPHRNSLFDTPITEQNEIFPFPTVSPLPTSVKDRDETESTVVQSTDTEQKSILEPQVRSMPVSMIDMVAPSFNESEKTLNTTSKFNQSKALPNEPSESQYKHQASKSELSYSEKAKPSTPVVGQLQDNSSSTGKKFGFKSLFKSKKASSSKEGNQSPQLSSSSKSPRLSFGMPSPALSSHSNHSRSKSFAGFSRFNENVKESKEVEPKKTEPKKLESKKVESTKSEIKSSGKKDPEKTKEKRKSMLSSWKRKSFSFGKPVDGIEAKPQKSSNRKSVFGKSKSLSNVTEFVKPDENLKTEDGTKKKTQNERRDVNKTEEVASGLPRSTTGTSLLETYGFNSASNTPQLDVIFSTPDIPIASVQEVQTEQIGNYIVSDNAASGGMEMKDVEPVLLTPKKAQFIEPFDDYQIELPFTPSPKKPQRRSLAPQYLNKANNSLKRDASVSSGLRIDFNDFELPSTPQLKQQQQSFRYNVIKEEELQFHGDVLASPRIHAGDSLFPKSLGAEEVESIVTLERSKSMRSVKSRNTSLHNGASIVEMMHDDVDRAVTADGMVVLRSPGFSPSDMSFSSPRSSKRASILKSPSKKHVRDRSVASFGSEYQVDLDDTQLTDLIAMFDFSEGNIDTNFNLDTMTDSNMLSFNDISEIESILKRSSSNQDSIALQPSPLPHLANVKEEQQVEDILPGTRSQDLEVSPEATKENVSETPVEQELLIQAESSHISSKVDYASESQEENEFSFSYTNDESRHQLIRKDNVSENSIKQVIDSPVVMEQTELNDLIEYVEDEESEDVSDEESLNHQINNFLESNRESNGDIDQYHMNTKEERIEQEEIASAEDDESGEEADPFSSIPASYNRITSRNSFDSTEFSSGSIRFTPIAEPEKKSYRTSVEDYEKYQGQQSVRTTVPIVQNKGLKGPSFNQSFKPATRSAILGSIAKSAASHSNDFSAISESSPFENNGHKVEPMVDDEFELATPTPPSVSASSFNRPSIISRFSNPGSNRLSMTESEVTSSKTKPKTLTKKKGYSISKSRDSLSSMAKLNMFSNKSTSSTNLESMIVTDKPGVKFSSRILLYDTYNEDEYDRHPEIATCNQLTPMLAQQIKDELNEFKAQMAIHEDSRCNTHFF